MQVRYQGKLVTLQPEQIAVASEGALVHRWSISKRAIKQFDIPLLGTLVSGATAYVLTKTAKRLKLPSEKLDRWGLHAHSAAQSRVVGLDVDNAVEGVVLHNREYALTQSTLTSVISIMAANQYLVTPERVKNKVVVDVGANTGLFSIHAMAHGAKRVHAFEPLPETLAILKQNINNNHLERVTIHPYAVGEKKGTATINYSGAGDQAATLLATSRGKATKVKVVSLDEQKLGKVDFLKIDSEGYEEQVLRGAAKLIKKYRPFIIMASYHRPGDAELLQRVVRSIEPSYTFEVKAHPERDLVCYPGR